MAQSEVIAALASAIDAESKVGIRWWPGVEMAPIALRRWKSFERRHRIKHPTVDDRMRNLATGLQSHFEPETPYTHENEWRHLARILADVFTSIGP